MNSREMESINEDEERPFHIMMRRRKRMEAAAKRLGNGNGGEIRRLHIIYFLSRMGRIEHPHLIRVHHLTRNGVYLLDVKRWLAEVRGKDMPDAFAWSYKRRYKNGYVWQDLLDDDLITPISDNEYVLKGSEIQPEDPCSYGVKQNQPSPKEEILQGQQEADPKLHTSPEIFQELPLFGSGRSTLTDDSMKLHEHDEDTNKKGENSGNPFYSSLLNKKKTKDKRTNNSIIDNDKGDTPTRPPPPSLFSLSSSSSKSTFAKSKSYSNGASNMFRNLIKCGAVDTNDAVLVTVNRAGQTCSTHSTNTSDCPASICQVDKLGGSARIFGTPWNNQHQQKYSSRRSFDGGRSSKKKQNQFASPKPVSAAYKPVGGPTCTLLDSGNNQSANSDSRQCGKSFKPEKLHSHMKSCKGMKALGKTSASAISVESIPPRRSVNLSPEESTSGYFLAN